MPNAQQIELMKEGYSADIELDEPTEVAWVEHTLAGLEDLDMDFFAAMPECEI